MATDFDIAYDQQDLRIIRKGFKAMDEQAQAEAKRVAGGLATYLQGKIQKAADSRPNRACLSNRCRFKGKQVRQNWRNHLRIRWSEVFRWSKYTATLGRL
jgi:hypothetical protein